MGYFILGVLVGLLVGCIAIEIILTNVIRELEKM